MNRRYPSNRLQLTTLVGLAMVFVAVLGASHARAAVGPFWDIRTTWADTNLPPGGTGQFQLQVRNVGDASPATPLTITDELPAGVTVTALHWDAFNGAIDLTADCSGVGTGTVACTTTSAKWQTSPTPSLPPLFSILTEPFPGKPSNSSTGYMPQVFIEVAIDSGAAGVGTNVARVEGGGSEPFEDVDQVSFGGTPAPFDVLPDSFLADNFTGTYPLGEPARQAGDRPVALRVNAEATQRTGVSAKDGTRYSAASENLRTVEVTLPRGMVGNPEAMPKCDPLDFEEFIEPSKVPACPSDTQVGYVLANLAFPAEHYGKGNVSNSNGITIPLYNLEPPKGVPADIGFNFLGIVQGHIYPILDPAQNYAIKSVTADIATSGFATVRSFEATIWGVPGDPANDRYRAFPTETEGKTFGAPFGSAPIRPFLTNPTDCGFDNGGSLIRIGSYEHSGFTPVQEYSDPMNVEGCEDQRFSFDPDVSLQPTSQDAGGPTGLDVHLEVPQRDDTVTDATDLYAKNGAVEAIPTPPVKKAVVTFPEGMTISPSAAQGLGNCSLEQIGIEEGVPNDDPVTCPDSSQYGTLTIHTPILPENAPPKGFIYVAKQGSNPFHEFLALYLVIEEPDRGILVKIPGRVNLDPKTGQITTTFDDLPQFPVSDLQLTLKGGVRAALVNPQTCGTKTITAEFFSWHDPTAPRRVEDSYEVTQKPDGSPCAVSLAARPFDPHLEAGTINPTAGAFSPFALRLTRTDDDQEFSQLAVELPEGLSAKIAGRTECPEGGIARAISRTGAGQGNLEQGDPSCPDSSLIGTTDVGVGVGVPLTYVPGKAYLAGPYQGAALSMVVITPAVVGPYDLGVIAVRSAIHVDPETVRVSVKSDPFPLIYQGIPVRIRDVRVRVDRPETTLNPTDCSPMQIGARVTGTGGDLGSTADDTAANLSERFQAADCPSLGFKPKLSFLLSGGTDRGAHPKFQATLRARPGDANIGRASVTLPRSEFLDQSHIRTVCTRVQFAAERCPQGSVYGFAKASTPLLDEPLSGPVYLRSSSNKLPDLVAVLKGKIEVNLVGRIDSVNGGIRNTFDVVPDAPVSTFTLTMQGGKKGLLINSTDLCSKPHHATTKLTAQNGKALTLRPAMRNGCESLGRKERKHR